MFENKASGLIGDPFFSIPVVASSHSIPSSLPLPITSHTTSPTYSYCHFFPTLAIRPTVPRVKMSEGVFAKTDVDLISFCFPEPKYGEGSFLMINGL